jgi:hypothetical protein
MHECSFEFVGIRGTWHWQFDFKLTGSHFSSFGSPISRSHGAPLNFETLIFPGQLVKRVVVKYTGGRFS